LLQQFEQALRNNYYYRNGMETLVAETATDGERLYANWFGICFAVDLKTGKLAWWTQKFTEMNNYIGNLPSSASNLENYAIAVGHGLVVAISLPIDRLNYWQEPFRVIAYDAATGKEKWKTQDNQALSNISFVGEPLIEPDQILVLGHEREGAMLSLYSLNHQGQQQWVAALGTARKRHTPRGTEVMPQPRMLRKGNALFVATQDGAMLAFDMVGRRLDWMLTYDGPEIGQSSRFFYGGVVDDTTLLHTQTAIAEFEGLLYLKEAGSSQLVAVDPSIPAVVWKRPVEPAAQLVGVDQDAVYVLDTELGAIDRQTHALRWATRLPIASGGLSALIGPKSIVVLTNRGLFELDRDTGNMKRIFRGADLSTLGGRLCRIGDQIVAITTESITSYRDPSSDAAGATQSTR
jgi:outer membrane protein assembly factor BamB